MRLVRQELIAQDDKERIPKVLKQNIILSVVLGVGAFYICSYNEYKVVVVKIKTKILQSNWLI